MECRGYRESRLYTGHIGFDTQTAPATFRTIIDQNGELKIDIDHVPFITGETEFIVDTLLHQGANFAKFSLCGHSDEGLEFNTNDMYLCSAKIDPNPNPPHILPVGGCSSATFRVKMPRPAAGMQLRFHLKGFESGDVLTSQCRLGVVEVEGKSPIDDPDTITGSITVRTDGHVADPLEWRSETEKFLEHIRWIMSFAAATKLQAPIIEYTEGDSLVVKVRSVSRQSGAPLRIFYAAEQRHVFEAAVNSYFSPPINVNNLEFALAWFTMDASYLEVRFMAAMTALENLIASNLREEGTNIIEQKKFNTIRNELKACITVFLKGKQWSDVDIGLACEKIGELNRKTFSQNFCKLVTDWRVPLNGIDLVAAKKAKKARDTIVHQGSYNDGVYDLVLYNTVVREIVVRFVLTIIGYRGGYLSYLGGCHAANFPPSSTPDG